MKFNFQNAKKYSVLKEQENYIVEETFLADYKAPPSERHLQCLWFDSKFRPQNIKTLSGEPVEIINPGNWNLEAGPDFLGATLLVGREKRRISGDVEIHTIANDWNAHKHSENPLYKNVIAHVFYNQPRDLAKLPTKDMVNISLKKSISDMNEFFFDKIDTTSYPRPVFPNNPSPCSKILSQWSQEKVTDFLEAAGEERLRLKTIRIASGILETNSDQILYEEIMGAMGYKHNSAAFKILANRLPLHLLKELSANSPAVAYAILLGVSGLLPSETSGTTEETALFIRTIWDNWWKHENELHDLKMSKDSWNFAFVRPQNHPERRLAAIAYLFCSENISAKILKNYEDDPKKWFKQTIKDLTQTPEITFWENYFSFYGEKKKYSAKMVGSQRASSIIINVITPWLAAQKKDIRESIALIPKEQTNSIITNTAYMLFGHDHNPALYNTALKQQGILQIYYDFCAKNIPSCTNCPLSQKLTIKN
ncbi:MAG: DUF2851 family protein [Kiritimatiellae bacterium]|jgi:hypothetical protein|nr:DUF2851 family protein [Kiritimatiellia bacterium]